MLPINESYHGSEFVAVWFRVEIPDDEPFRRVLYDGIRAIPWEQLAQDFDFESPWSAADTA